MLESVYTRAGVGVRRYQSTDDYFANRDFGPAVHVVPLRNGNHVDLVISRPLDEPIVPLFFSGALSQRSLEMPPPYFSGVRIAASLGVPWVAMSDPTLQIDHDVKLGWYAGGAGENSQDTIAAILRDLALHCGKLLFVGGSGGGFASLYFAERVGRSANAFVWNPQTDLMRYAPVHVRQYAATALADQRLLDEIQFDEAQVRVRLTEAGIDTTVPQLAHSGEVFVLQSASDWHVAAHAKPLGQRSGLRRVERGLYASSTGRQVIALSNYGEGHNPPSPELVEAGMRLMLEGRTPDMGVGFVKWAGRGAAGLDAWRRLSCVDLKWVWSGVSRVYTTAMSV